MSRRASALAFTAFSLAALLRPGPCYAQDQTPPVTQPGSSATEPPATGGAASSSTGSRTAAPIPQSPAVQLPPVVITQPSPAQKTKQAVHKTSTAKASAPSQQPSHVSESSAGGTPAATAAQVLAAKGEAFNNARTNLLTQIGTTSYEFNQEAIQTLPQGNETPVDKVLLQAPGVTQDSAASGLLHVRNEHANLQYRINGIILPDGVSGFGQILDTQFVSSVTLITGALPAEFGYRTSGLVDIQTKSGSQDPGGSIGLYGGSQRTLTPSIEYSGTTGQTDYFFTGQYFTSDEGIENPT